MHPLLETLKARFPEAVLSTHEDQARSELSARVAAGCIVEIATFLHDDPAAAFDQITDICSACYPVDAERFEVIYHMLALPHRTRFLLKARVTDDDTTIASVSRV